LQILLANQKQAFTQQLQEEQSKTQIASQALESAMQRLGTLEGIATSLQSAMNEGLSM
jgi:hypothetical protein